MRRFCVLILAGLITGPAAVAHAAGEPRLEPGLYVEIPFGGRGAAAPGAQFTARLDYRAGEMRLPTTPAVVQWRLNGAHNAVELMGLPLVAGAGYRVANTEEATGGKVAKAVGFSVGATLAVGGLAVWALSEAMEGFGDALGESMVENMFGGEAEGGDDTGTPAEPCTGVQVGDECITTSGGGG
jgi:hypothetical protein